MQQQAIGLAFLSVICIVYDHCLETETEGGTMENGVVASISGLVWSGLVQSINQFDGGSKYLNEYDERRDITKRVYDYLA